MDTISENKTRQSGIELLKIIALILICLSHVTQTTRNLIDVGSSLGFQNYIIKAFSNLGFIGNTIFVICSIWFLIDSKKTNSEKIINILLDSIFVSICFLIGYLIAGFNFDAKTIVMQFLPDVFSNVWFIPFYVILYVFHPILNGGLERLSKKTHLCLSLTLFFVFGIISLFIRFEFINDVIFGFILYILISYLKKYKGSLCDNTKINLIVFFSGVVLFIGLMLLKEVNAYLKDNLFLFYQVSLFLGPSLFGLFNLFRKINFKSRVVNYLSSCSLFFYCFHENILFRENTRIDLVKFCIERFGTNYLLIIILGFTICFTIAVFVISILYKETAHRLTAYLSKKISNASNKILNKIVKD